MTFGNIYWLYAFLPVLVILILNFYHVQKKRRSLIQSFAAPNLLPTLLSSFSYRRYYFKILLLLASIFFIFAALSEPRWGYIWIDQKSKGVDILFALDVSKSMLAEDIKPNRLERAKYSILDLVKKLQGDRFGLIAFSGIAFLQCPLTLDYSAFTECLKQTDPSSLNRGGTNIAAAIRTAIPVFSKENNFKILILISDGEDLEESGISEAQNASKDHITIYTVGVGTPSGELIPIKTADNSTDFLRDPEGKIVKTKLDESTLSKIAESTGGFYTPLGPKGEGLENIYHSAINNIPKQELTSTLRQVPMERFQWPLGIAIILFILSMLLSTRAKNFRTTSNLLLITFLINLFSNNLTASPVKAYKAYESNQFQEASDLYNLETQKYPNTPPLHYNLGTSLYKNSNYNDALSAFNKAIKTQDLPLQQKIFYNIGNTLYRKGQETIQKNPQETIKLWEQSIDNYQSSLELDPSDLHAQENIDFVKKKIEELKQKQEEQQKNQPKEQNQNNSNQKDQQNNSSSNSQSQELPPNENSSNSSNSDKQESNESNSPEEKNDQNKNKESQNSSSKEKSSTVTGSMTQEEAEEFLKSFKNSEQKLPAVNEKSNPLQYSENFKDW